jgi:hypothetical protein
MQFTKRVLKIMLEPRLVWSTAIYIQEEPFTPLASLPRPWKVFNAKRIDPLGRYPHTYADPFLFEHADRLYIFLEIAYKEGHGEITAFCTNDLQRIEHLGVILSKPFHLSFPFVFGEALSVYMVVESKKADKVSLYQFEAFPFELREVRTLLRGSFVDTHLFKSEDTWYLFTTSNDKLYLYFADDFLSGEFHVHPASPITGDKRISRSGGSILNLGGRLYRVAQDCSTDYGQNVSLIEIKALSPSIYEESITVEKVFPLNNSWDARGAHHLNVCKFRDKTIIVADGKQPDFFINRFSSLLRFMTVRSS